jgi:hypothetical protein
MISFSWGRIASLYNARPVMLFIVSFVEKRLQHWLQVGIMGSENVREVTHIALKYHSSRIPPFDQSDLCQDNKPK